MNSEVRGAPLSPGESGDRLASIKAKLTAATAGPWHWAGNTHTHTIDLRTVGRGGLFVMTFRRWGMRSAEPWFQPRAGEDYGLKKAHEMVEYEVSYRKDIVGIDHPDARLVADAPADLEWCIAEIERLRADLDAAHYYFNEERRHGQEATFHARQAGYEEGLHG